VPHIRGRHGQRGLRGASRCVYETLEGGCAPASSRLVPPEAGMRAPGCRWGVTRCRLTVVRATASRSAGIDTGPGGGPQTHDDAHRRATGRTAGRERCRGRARCRLARAGVALDQQQADGRAWDGTAGREQAAVAALHAAVRPDLWEEPPEKLHDVKARRTEACPAHLTGGAGERAVGEADETVGGEGDREDRGGARGAGGVAG
jgi:hypothetical protein